MTRDETLDGLKFLLVSLVILGHAIEPTRYSDDVSGILYSLIYAFHMPMFVMLSGYFSKNLYLPKLNKQSVALIETYLVMAITMGLLLGKGLKLVVAPSLSCWYILSLICWRYMVFWLIEIRKCTPKQLIAVSLFIMTASFLMPITHGLGTLSLMRTSQFFFFFAIGYCMSEDFILKMRNNTLCKISLWSLSIVILYLIGRFSCRDLHVLEFHRDTMFSLMGQFNCSHALCCYYKALLLVASLTICFTLVTIGKFPRFFRKYGSYTLSFYFLQGVVIHKMVQVMPSNLYLEILASGSLIVLGGG